MIIPLCTNYVWRLFSMTMKEKQEQWHRHIMACTSSGLSIQEWCKTNAISPDQYHYWKRKFNKQEFSSQEDKTQWAPLVIQNPKKSSLSAQPITLQTGNFKVVINKDFDKQTLTDVLQVLGALC